MKSFSLSKLLGLAFAVVILSGSVFLIKNSGVANNNGEAAVSRSSLNSFSLTNRVIDTTTAITTPFCTAPNLIQNGSFETPVVNNSYNRDIYPNGTVPGWSVAWQPGSGNGSTANIEIQRIYSAQDGNQYVELDSGFNHPNGTITNEAASTLLTQNFQTTPGKTYDVTFYLSARPGSNHNDTGVTFYLNGGVLDSSFNTSIGEYTSGTYWITRHYKIVASGTTTTIGIGDSGIPNSQGTFLDNVAVQDCSGDQGNPIYNFQVSTQDASAITANQASLNGTIVSTDGQTVKRYFEWGTSSSNLNQTTTVSGTTGSTGDFATSISGLNASTQYYFHGCVEDTSGGNDKCGVTKNFTTSDVIDTTTAITTPFCTAPNLIQNGSFETPVVNNSYNRDIYPNGTVPGWSVAWQPGSGNGSTANIEIQRIYSAQDGNQYVELDSGFNHPNGTITNEAASTLLTQNFQTTPGKTYDVTFYLSARPGSNHNDTGVTFYLNGGVLDSSFNTSIGEYTSGTYWITRHYKIVASGTTTTIGIGDSGIPNSQGTFLDNVAVQDCSGDQGNPIYNFQVSTQDASAITANQASLNGTIVSTDGQTVKRYFEWGTSSSNLNQTTTVSGTTGSTGDFATSISGLNASTQYYFHGCVEDTSGGNDKCGVTKNFTTLAPVYNFQVSTQDASAITANQASLNGTIVSTDGQTVKRYFEWGTSSSNLNQTTTVSGTTGSTGDFATSISGLNASTQYYFHGCVEDTSGGNDKCGVTKNFTTLAPVYNFQVSTQDASAITANQASLNGTIVSTDGQTVKRYFEWGTSSSNLNQTTTVSGTTGSTGDFATSISGLNASTQYYFHGCVEDTSGGNDKCGVTKNFTTLAPVYNFQVSTQDASAITANQASLNGTIVSTDGQTVKRYFEWGTSSSNLNQTTTVSGTTGSTGDFATSISGLNASTQYYFHGCVEDTSGGNDKCGVTKNFTTAAVSLPGCTNPLATNYNSQATVDDGSCVLPTPGGDQSLQVSTTCPTTSALIENSSTILSVPLCASVQNTTSPATIKLQWTAISGQSIASGTISRRAGTASSWTQVGTTGSGVKNWTDTNVTEGVYYEYKVELAVSTGTGNAIGYIASGINVPSDVSRGKLILVIDNTYQTSLATQIQKLTDELTSDRWVVSPMYVSRTATPASIRSSIQAIYNSDPSNTKAVYLLGHVPVPVLGNTNPDGHASRAFSSDLYYGEMNSTFSQSSTTGTCDGNSSFNWCPLEAPGIDTPASANRFSLSGGNLPSSTELEVGRLDMYQVTAFGGTETSLLTSYLNKVSEFKKKQFTPTNRAFIRDYFNYNGWTHGQVYMSTFSSNVGSNNLVMNNETAPIMASLLDNQSYVWTYGNYYGANVLGSQTEVVGGTASVATTSWGGLFNIGFGSYWAEWNAPNAYLKSILASGKAMTSVYGPRNWYFHSMGMGKDIGYSAKLSVNNTSSAYSPVAANPNWGNAGNSFMSLMGDPTLRDHYVGMPSNVNLTNNNGKSALSWSASSDDGIGYNIYEILSNQIRRVNPSVITGTSYVSTDNYSTSRKYMVTRVKIEKTNSGTYINESLGAIQQ
jgi:hypothetical protein